MARGKAKKAGSTTSPKPETAPATKESSSLTITKGDIVWIDYEGWILNPNGTRTLFDTTRGDLRDYLTRELGDAAKEPKLYAERSAITYAKNIRAALLVLQGANDPRVPKAEALQIVEALKTNAAPHQYHEYSDEGHGFSRLENRVDALRRTVDWLAEYLTPLMDRYLTD